MKSALVLTTFFLITVALKSQDLLSPSHGFSHKKTSYITLTDGTQITGTLKDIDRKKGLIKYVNIEDGAGTKHKLKPAKIKFMYLPPTAIDNLDKKYDFVHDAQKWNKDKLDQDMINAGYVYFENANVKVKKKEQQLLMQLLNPTFSNNVRVYHDPTAKETTSLGIAGVDVVGGNDKSYYVLVDNSKAAFKLSKKNYRDEFPGLWSKCPSVKKAYPKVSWGDFTKHVITYSDCAAK